MALGTYIGNTFTDLTGINIPMYVGSMFVAVIIRNVSELSGWNIVDLKLMIKSGISPRYLPIISFDEYSTN